MKALVHYAEIGLKGKNRPFFEKKLAENIEAALKRNKVKADVLRESNRIILNFQKKDSKKVEAALKTVFGVKYFAFAEETKPTVPTALKKADQILAKIKTGGKKRVSLETKRSDKKFSLTSIDLNKKIGEIAHRKGLKIDFSNPEETVRIEITKKNIMFYATKIAGPGGLPVGSSSKVIVLLSGGIDSAAAAWLMMKRGCRVDFLHFHASRKNKEVMNSKIVAIVKKLNKYQQASKLYLVPYHNYQLLTMGKVGDSMDVVVFKNFMTRFAEKLAYKNHYRAVVTGDSIGQVASQTLGNIAATSHKTSALILRPLITYDKQEIIALAESIGTYGESIKQYRDCCSIVSRKPTTFASYDDMKKAMRKIKMNAIIDKSLKEMEVVKVK